MTLWFVFVALVAIGAAARWGWIGAATGVGAALALLAGLGALLVYQATHAPAPAGNDGDLRPLGDLMAVSFAVVGFIIGAPLALLGAAVGLGARAIMRRASTPPRSA